MGKKFWDYSKLKLIVEKIGRVIGVDRERSDVDTYHRLPTRSQQQPPNIVVKLVRRTTKFEILRKFKSKKPKLGDIDPQHPFRSGRIYVSEYLLPANAQLYRNVRNLRKERDIRYLWVEDCKILARIADGDPIIRILSNEDIENLKTQSQPRLPADIREQSSQRGNAQNTVINSRP